MSLAVFSAKMAGSSRSFTSRARSAKAADDGLASVVPPGMMVPARLEVVAVSEVADGFVVGHQHAALGWDRGDQALDLVVDIEQLATVGVRTLLPGPRPQAALELIAEQAHAFRHPDRVEPDVWVLGAVRFLPVVLVLVGMVLLVGVVLFVGVVLVVVEVRHRERDRVELGSERDDVHPVGARTVEQAGERRFDAKTDREHEIGLAHAGGVGRGSLEGARVRTRRHEHLDLRIDPGHVGRDVAEDGRGSHDDGRTCLGGGVDGTDGGGVRSLGGRLVQRGDGGVPTSGGGPRQGRSRLARLDGRADATRGDAADGPGDERAAVREMRQPGMIAQMEDHQREADRLLGRR